MNNNRNIYVISLIVSLCTISCQDYVSRNVTAEKKISINPDDINENDYGKASKYFKNIDYIPLETTDDCTIGEISRIKIVGNMLFIEDKISNSIFLFNINGKFIRRIGVIGRSNNEYIRISSFDVNSKTLDIDIYCEFKQSIIRYNINGEFVSNTKIGVICQDVMITDTTHLFYTGRMPNDKLFAEILPMQKRVLEMKNDSLLNSYLPFQYNDILLSTSITSDQSPLYKYKEKIRIIERCNGIVYELNDSIKCKYSIEFDRYTIPFNFYDNTRTISKRIIDNLKESKYCYLKTLLETENYIYIEYVTINYNNLVCRAMYSKLNDKTVNFGPLWINDIDNVMMPNLITSNGNTLIGYYYADNLISMINSNTKAVGEKLINIKDVIKNLGNPIICIITL